MLSPVPVLGSIQDLCTAGQSRAGGEDQQLPPQDANPASLQPCPAVLVMALREDKPGAGSAGQSLVLKTLRFNPWVGHSLRSWA